jgi:hypothetical protein
MIRDSLQCPRILTYDEIAKINFDEYTTQEIKHLIACNSIKESDVIAFYGNEWWDQFVAQS